MRRIMCLGILGLLPVLADAGPVDINTADAATIARELNGIGDEPCQGDRRVSGEERPVCLTGGRAEGQWHRARRSLS